MGFQVERHVYATGVNVVGTRAGDKAEPTVLVSAHYDHIEDCPGADDDGTGVAAVLELARIFSTATYAGTLMLACWDEEECGLLGSKAYVALAKTRGTTISSMMGFEMLGYRSSAPNSQIMPASLESFYPQQAAQARANELRGDFIGLVYDQMGALLGTRVGKHATAEGLPIMEFMVPAELKKSSLAADFRRSDHATFWDADIPAIMLSDTADLRNPNYHCKAGPDAVADLDMDFAVKVVRAAAGTLAETLVVR
jgi:Zn-dependent M28 family amino/carboxypeptidase